VHRSHVANVGRGVLVGLVSVSSRLYGRDGETGCSEWNELYCERAGSV
jgi:hypothetical protein